MSWASRTAPRAQIAGVRAGVLVPICRGTAMQQCLVASRDIGKPGENGMPQSAYVSATGNRVGASGP